MSGNITLVIIIGGIIFAAIIIFVQKIINSRQEKHATPPPQTASPHSVPRQRRSVICSRCIAIIREYDAEKPPIFFGTPLRICPHCNQEYCDADYHEIALEGTLTGDRYYATGSKEAEMAASKKRLADWKYIDRLSASPYAEKSSTVMAGLRERAADILRPYLEALQANARLQYGDFRVHDFENTFDRLTYDAHDAVTVELVVRQVLAHYGLDSRNIRVEVEYVKEPVPENGGTLGSFAPSAQGGLVRVVMDPNYSDYDTVVAVILHECAHALLHALRLHYPDKGENERLTDLAAIYFGGGAYILRGYFRPDGRRMGYLSRFECEVAQTLVQEYRKSAAARAQAEKARIQAEWAQLRDRLGRLAEETDGLCRSLHPGRVVREASLHGEFTDLWQRSEVDRAEALHLITQAPADPQAALRQGRPLEAALSEFLNALREWSEAEQYQALLPAAALQTVRGIAPLVEQGNAFARLEMIRYWHGCPATRRDAALYHQKLLEAEDRDSLCALGLCRREGLCGERSEEEARAYFLRAAALGSPDAQRLLNDLTH